MTPMLPCAPLPVLSLPQVREICLLFTRGVDYRWQRMALLALQEVGVEGPRCGGGGVTEGLEGSYGCCGGVQGA